MKYRTFFILLVLSLTITKGIEFEKDLKTYFTLLVKLSLLVKAQCVNIWDATDFQNSTQILCPGKLRIQLMST